jgi:hypothetical protein
MSEPQDYAHEVPPEAFMPWKENWFFVGVDPESGVATSFHWSLRPQIPEGILSAKLVIDGVQYRYVGRPEIPRQLKGFHPVADDHLSLEVLEEGKRYRIRFSNDELTADITYTGRFDTFDFNDGHANPGSSTMGDVGRTVFHFRHQEQALAVDGTVTLHEPGGDRTIAVGGWASRDHSWGFRDDHLFINHHWICASFPERFVQGTAMHERSYDGGMKFGGFVSSAAGNVATTDIDVSQTYWETTDVAPLPALDRDVAYTLTTADGERIEIVARLSEDHGRLDLHFRNKERTEAYEDRLIFCTYEIPATGEVGNGVLEVGKHLRGADAVAQLKRPTAGVA